MSEIKMIPWRGGRRRISYNLYKFLERKKLLCAFWVSCERQSSVIPYPHHHVWNDKSPRDIDTAFDWALYGGNHDWTSLSMEFRRGGGNYTILDGIDSDVEWI